MKWHQSGKGRKQHISWVYKDFRSILKPRQTLHCESVFLMYFGWDFQLFLQHDHNLEPEERLWQSVLLHSLGKPWVLQEGHVGEGSRGSWYSQRCPPCTSRDGDWTWPGFFEDVSGIQELTETNPDEHPNSVSRSSAQKWSLCLEYRWDGSWPGLWACC